MSTPEPSWLAAYPYDDGSRPRDHASLGIAALALAGLVALLWTTSSLASIKVAAEIEAGASFDDVSIPALSAFSLPALMVIPVLIGAWIVTGLWLMKAQTVASLESTRFVRQQYARAWGLMGWVVPIANVFVPLRYVRDIYEACAEKRYSRLLGWWWASWLLALLLNRVHTAVLDSLDPFDGAGAATVMGLLTSGAALVAVALWALVVRRIIAGQSAQVRDWRPSAR